MTLSAPTFIVWLISTILAAFVLAIEYAGVGSMVPVVGSTVAGNSFIVLLVAYVLLWAGTVLKGV